MRCAHSEHREGSIPYRVDDTKYGLIHIDVTQGMNAKGVWEICDSGAFQNPNSRPVRKRPHSKPRKKTPEVTEEK